MTPNASSSAEVTLKSGAVVRFDCTELTVSKSPVTKEFSGLKWKTPEGAERALMHVNLDEVAAVVFIDGA